METSEILARHHRRVVDEFIESVLDELDLTDLARNVVGLAIRREVETELVPGIAAVQALFHAADSATLARSLPEWLERTSSVIPGGSEFFTGMSRRLDPDGCDLLEENVGLLSGEAEVRRAFDAHLCEMAPCVSMGVGYLT